MSLYLTLKWLHIISSVLLVGTGLGSAFYMLYTNRDANVQAQAVVSRLVVRADWWFTTPTVFIQPATGLVMAAMAGLPAMARRIHGALSGGGCLLAARGVAAAAHA